MRFADFSRCLVQDEVIKAAHVESEDGGGRFTVTQALKDQAVIDLSKVCHFPLLLTSCLLSCGDCKACSEM